MIKAKERIRLETDKVIAQKRRGMMARKRLGQHFLIDENIVEMIVSAVAPQGDDIIVEIGPGHGALTWPLLKQAHVVHAIELDKTLCERLDRQKNSGLKVYCADALSFDYSELADRGKLRLVGNLPYNIASPLLFRLFDATDRIVDMHFMLQAEVAQNLSAKAGEAAYSRMSIMAACCARVHHLFDVEAHAFMPPPKVQSSFVKITPRKKPCSVSQRQKLDLMVKKMFAARRKTLRKIFARQLSERDLEAAGIPPTARPGELDYQRLMVLLDLLQGALREP